MTYKLKNIKSISKFTVLDFGKNIRGDDYLNLSNLFWKTILDRNNLEKFINEKYKEFKLNKSNDEEFEYFIRESNYVLSKLDYVKDGINFLKNDEISKAGDIFLSFRLFNVILFYYNDYYSKSDISLSLTEGIIFKDKLDNLDDFFSIILDLENNTFIKEIFLAILLNNIDYSDSFVFKIEIFWPNELIIAGFISKILKKLNPEIKIVIDFSSGNEQFDFTQWLSFLKNDSRFFDFFDFFIINNDFGKGIKDIINYVNSEKHDLENIVYFKDEEILFTNDNKGHLNEDMLKAFVDYTFQPRKIFTLLGKRTFFARFLPYKCYWNNCSFCAINAGNQFTYTSKFGYDYFIDKWVDFIIENDIESLTFMDEAMPPKVIIAFADKIRTKKQNFRFQFRTRFDKLYTLKNCKILYEGGARFCGIGLESAVDRVNEGIGNKGDIGMTIFDKLKQIHYFDHVGIPFHNYSIMGFPGETDNEAFTTYKFLKGNIEKGKFITCTPNIFSLMRGPEIFRNKEKYGIDIDSYSFNNPFNLSFNFKYNGQNRNLNLLDNFVRDLHRLQFLPWLNIKTYIDITGFWHYIDRSYIFYLTKKSYIKNPFHSYNNINNDILYKTFDTKLDSYYTFSEYSYFFTYKNNDYIYDWVSCSELFLEKDFRLFLENYNDNISLRENLKIKNIPYVKNLALENFIDNLLRGKILLIK
ncbi:MAG: radical SAM protein [Candidatus Gracilibacteria bacterium]|nr:radical SAM protein [Candidatus Gracilibacteria bacterium]